MCFRSPPPLPIETFFHTSGAANKKNYYTLIFVKSREICFWCEYLTVLSFFLSFGLVYDRNKMTLAWRQTIYFHCHMTCVILIPFSQESFYSLAKLIFSKLEWKAYSGDWNAPFPFVYRLRMSSNSSCIHSFIRLIIGRNLANWLHCRARKYHRIQFCPQPS